MKIIRTKIYSDSDRKIKWAEAKKGAITGAKVGLGLSIIPASLGRVIGGDTSSTAGRIAAGSILAAGTVLGTGLGAIQGYKRGKNIINVNKLLESNPELKRDLDYVTNFKERLNKLNSDFHSWLSKKNNQLLKNIEHQFFNDYRYPGVDIRDDKFQSNPNSMELFEIYEAFGDDVGDQYFFTYNMKENKIVVENHINSYPTKIVKKNISVKELKPTIIKLFRNLEKQTPEKEYIEQLQDYYEQDNSKEAKAEIDKMIKLRREVSKSVEAFTNELVGGINKI